MTHDEFVGQVQSRARLDSSGDALRAIRVTLETLAERLEGGMADNIAAQLPPEIGRFLRTDTSFERLSLGQFFHRIWLRESEGKKVAIDPPESTFHARVVIEVLFEALSEGSVRKLMSLFPQDYEPLFTAGSRGRMRVGDAERDEAR